MGLPSAFVDRRKVRRTTGNVLARGQLPFRQRKCESLGLETGELLIAECSNGLFDIDYCQPSVLEFRPTSCIDRSWESRYPMLVLQSQRGRHPTSSTPYDR